MKKIEKNIKPRASITTKTDRKRARQSALTDIATTNAMYKHNKTAENM